ncbi:MAG TPA: N-acetylmuramoyl-L-alanine amidase [Candidatus Udaeobacter sp.]|nr:N-acetylmuramoyl-L-alanine amidase [Candidatus Udaeobacter sp.]
MSRFRLWLATAVALGAIAGSFVRGQVSNDEEKSADESGKSQHETSASSSPTPKKSPKPVAKAKTASSKSKKKRSTSPTPRKSPSPIPKAKLATEESSGETDTSGTPKESPHSDKTKGSGEEEEERPKAKPTETPESTVAPKKSRKSPSPTPKPKGAKKKSQKKKASSKGKKSAKAKTTREEKETPKPEKTPTPPPEKAAEPSEDSTPPPPRAVAVPTPAVSPRAKVPRAAPAEERAQVVIEKSGIEEDQGFEPPPPPPPRKGFWPWSLSRPKAYRYLTSSVIEAIRRAPVKRRRWQFIVVHNSGTRQGNARAFDYYHRNVRRMRNGLAYHFVIGNGTSSGNGQIEIGDRWRRQINGGHVHSDYLNNISLGICLVGDFNRDQPTRAQLESCEELIRYLRERCGKVGMRSIIVRPHREMNPPRWATDCPGDDFPYSWFRRF